MFLKKPKMQIILFFWTNIFLLDNIYLIFKIDQILHFKISFLNSFLIFLSNVSQHVKPTDYVG